MTPTIERYQAMDYVVRQIRAMLADGSTPEEALKSIEVEITMGMYQTATMLKQYGEAMIASTEPGYQAIMNSFREPG